MALLSIQFFKAKLRTSQFQCNAEVDEEDLDSFVFDDTVDMESGLSENFQTTAYRRSDEGADDMLRCTVAAPPVGDVYLAVPLLLNRRSEAEVRVYGPKGEHTSYKISARADKEDNSIHDLVQANIDITGLLHRSEETPLSVDATCGEEPATIAIQAYESGISVRAYRVFGSVRAWVGVVWYAALWLLILALALRVFSFLGSAFMSFYKTTAFAATLIWLSTILGFPSGITKRINSMSGRIALRFPTLVRGIIATSLLAADGYLLTGSATYLHLIEQRRQYTAHIESYLDSSSSIEPLQEAFLIFPWRIEAQILIREHSRSRSFNPEHFEEAAAEFCAVPEVILAVRNSIRPSPAIDTQKSYTYRNPAVWYGMTLAESTENFRPPEDPEIWPYSTYGFAASTEILEDSIRSQSNSSNELESIFADIYLQFAKGSLNEMQGKNSYEEVERLKEICTEHRSKISLSFAYQIACDNLGMYFLEEYAKKYSPSDKDANQDDWDNAILWFTEALKARVAEAKRPLHWSWHPNKLSLYWLFTDKESGSTKKTGTPQQVIAKYESNALSRLRTDLINNTEFAAFLKPETWVKGTYYSVIGKSDPEKLTKMIREEMLPNGWNL